MCKINLANAITQQKNLDIHQDWWVNKTEQELIDGLQKKVEDMQNIISKIERYEDITQHEMALVYDLKKYIKIITAE